MFDLDKWNEILQTITRNKTRSLLTAFGIFWGIFMLVLLLGGGKGVRGLITDNFSGFAQNTVVIGAAQTTKPFKGYGSGRTWTMELDDAKRLKSEVPGIDVCTPLLGAFGTIANYGKHSCTVNVQGAETEYSRISTPEITIGRNLSPNDMRERRKVCVIGSRVREELFPGQNPIGCHIEVDGVYYQVVGVNTAKGNINIMGPADKMVSIPLNTFRQVYNRGNAVDMLCLTGLPEVATERLEGEVRRVLCETHFIAPDDEAAILFISLEAMFRMVDSLFTGLNLLIWLIGIGTLLSGIIGVSNIMMVTVRERTVEIGIRRAIGARPAGILGQILTESVVITIMAGLSGISLAILVLAGVESAMKAADMAADCMISFSMALGSAFALALLGLLAGLAPGLRALSIRPIDAIRDE